MRVFKVIDIFDVFRVCGILVVVARTVSRNLEPENRIAPCEQFLISSLRVLGIMLIVNALIQYGHATMATADSKHVSGSIAR